MIAREVLVGVDREPATSEEWNVEFRVAPDCRNGGMANYSLVAADGTITSLFYKVPCECEIGWEGMSCALLLS